MAFAQVAHLLLLALQPRAASQISVLSLFDRTTNHLYHGEDNAVGGVSFC